MHARRARGNAPSGDPATQCAVKRAFETCSTVPGVNVTYRVNQRRQNGQTHPRFDRRGEIFSAP